MEPRLRFARTADGLALAFWTLGDGIPIIHMPWLPWSHVQLELANPEMRRWYDALSTDFQVIRYDTRGAGLSERNPEELGVESQIRDLDAVVEALKLDRFVLLGVYNSGPAAIEYAARNPGRVSKLLLWCTYASATDYNQSPRVASIRELINDWELYTETGAHAFVGWAAGQSAHEVALLMREAADQQTTRRFFEAMRDVDCHPSLPRITAPTLVLHPRRFPLIDIGFAREIAAAISDARLLALEGDSMAPGLANMDTAIEAIREHLRDTPARVALETLEPAVAIPAAAVAPDGLTVREVEVLRLVAMGKNSREIADELVLSPRTVERHLANIYAKANITNRAQATAYALSNHLV